MCVISGENEVKVLNTAHLKTDVDVEWNAFKNHVQKELSDHCIDAKGNFFRSLMMVLHCYASTSIKLSEFSL